MLKANKGSTCSTALEGKVDTCLYRPCQSEEERDAALGLD